jgi:hypothetical protein
MALVVVSLTSRAARTIVMAKSAISAASGKERTDSKRRLAPTTEPSVNPTRSTNDRPTKDMNKAAVATDPIAMTTYVVAVVPLNIG